MPSSRSSSLSRSNIRSKASSEAVPWYCGTAARIRALDSGIRVESSAMTRLSRRSVFTCAVGCTAGCPLIPQNLPEPRDPSEQTGGADGWQTVGPGAVASGPTVERGYLADWTAASQAEPFGAPTPVTSSYPGRTRIVRFSSLSNHRAL